MAAPFPASGYSLNNEQPSTDPSDSQAPEPQEEGDAVKVIIRVRPPLDRELNGFRPYAPSTAIDPNGRTITLSENLRAAANNGVENGMVYNTYRFHYDRIYAPETPQHMIYEESARGAVTNVLQGYNASIIAFGQTGAGKTHTMTGALAGEGRGIIPRAVDDVFAHIQRDTGERCKFLVRASYLQIYNEVISDLLKPESVNLTIREDRRRGVHVDGLSEWVVRTPADVYALMERGAAARATGATKLNELSSRSHAIFILIVEKSTLEVDENVVAAAVQLDAAADLSHTAGVRQIVKVGKLNLVDLAGSERVHLTGATGKRLEESKKINQSLSALGNVIAALTDPKGRGGRPHIPYRDSKLTRILEDSLGGNCKTTFMAMISPAVEAFAESLSTLKFAHRAKCVRNAPKINEDLDHVALLRKYERELRKLRAELQQRSKELVDRRVVLQIEEARRREQADKIAAITALERQSAEIAKQKANISTLKARIESMQSQLLIGGQDVQNTPAFRTLLAAEQQRVEKQYEVRLAELEMEKNKVMDSHAKVEYYGDLLQKQSAVMKTLEERNGAQTKEILELREKLDAAENRAREAEDLLDRKMAELIAVRKSVVVNDAAQLLTGVDIDGEENSAGNNNDWKIPASPGARGAKVNTGPLEVEALSGSESESLTVDISVEEPAAGGAVSRKSTAQNSTVALLPEHEKDALRFILEKKVLKLVGDVESSIINGQEDSYLIVNKQLVALKQIVSQTVDALRAPSDDDEEEVLVNGGRPQTEAAAYM